MLKDAVVKTVVDVEVLQALNRLQQKGFRLEDAGISRSTLYFFFHREGEGVGEDVDVFIAPHYYDGRLSWTVESIRYERYEEPLPGHTRILSEEFPGSLEELLERT